MPRLAVFDVDHTITRRSTGRRLLQCGRRAGLFSVADLLAIPYHYLRYRGGNVNLDQVAAHLTRLEGRPRHELETLAASCFERHVRDDIMPEATETILAHARAGDVVVFATSSLRLIVKPLADHFDVSYVLATELGFEAGAATGRLATPPCYGEEKRDRVIALASALRIELAQTTFYSDSHADLPLLRVVGSPVAVNPDAKLKQEARARGWEIVAFR